MAAKLIKGFLDSWGVRYLSIRHSPAHTAQEVAQLSHISGRNFAKTVIVKIEGIMAMLVIPANRRVNLPDLAETLQVDHLRLATEEEFKARFPDCELGAMPPFGNLYDMSTYIAEELTEEKEMAFNAGTHDEVITLRYEDYKSLVKPAVLSFITI
jgi:Ala-tRNA(Pro) deacylase